MSNAKHKSQARKIQRRVWLTGTAGAVYLRGTGVCYNRDYGTATENEGERDSRVEKPSTTNNRSFAGVLDATYTIPSTGEIQVTINEPGSICDIAIGVDTVVNTGMINCSAGEGDQGRFTLGGFSGRGAAVPLQTNASGRLAGEWDGTGSMATTGLTLTAGAAQFGDCAAGDTVYIVGGEDEDGTAYIVPGKYTIASKTSSTVIVLTSTCVSSTPAGAVLCSYYVMNGNQTCLAELLDGDESGLIEVVTPPNTGGSAVMSYMVGGVTYINGAITVATANANGALADGDRFGLEKGFKCLGTITTSEVEVTLATAGLQATTEDTAGTTGALLALASITFDAADEIAFLKWVGIWKEIASSGATLAAS